MYIASYCKLENPALAEIPKVKVSGVALETQEAGNMKHCNYISSINNETFGKTKVW